MDEIEEEIQRLHYDLQLLPEIDHAAEERLKIEKGKQEEMSKTVRTQAARKERYTKLYDTTSVSPWLFVCKGGLVH